MAFWLKGHLVGPGRMVVTGTRRPQGHQPQMTGAQVATPRLGGARPSPGVDRRAPKNK